MSNLDESLAFDLDLKHPHGPEDELAEEKPLGVVIPTIEGKRYGVPGIDLSRERERSLLIREHGLKRVAKGKLSEGEKFFLDQVAEEEEVL